MPLNALNFRLRLAIEETADIQSITDWPSRNNAVMSRVVEFAPGTAAGQADLQYRRDRTLSSGATDSLDLAGGLTNAFGATLTFVRVVGFFIYNGTLDGTTAANTTALTVGGGSNPWQTWNGGSTRTVIIPPGGFLGAIGGSSWTVTAGTGDILRIVNASGAANTYSIGIFGTSA